MKELNILKGVTADKNDIPYAALSILSVYSQIVRSILKDMDFGLAPMNPIAKKLIKVHKMNQKQAANSLGVTQAAISNYVRGIRGTGGYDIFDLGTFPKITGIVDQIASMMVEEEEMSKIIAKFNEACYIIRSHRMLCDTHKRLDPKLDVDNCHVCEEESEFNNFNIELKI